MSKLTVAQKIAEGLKRHGVEAIFAQSLPSAVILAAEDLGIRQIAYRTENAGGTMADAYARVSGKVAVVAAQNGPAATLLVPPLSEAMKASIPIVALVQEVETRFSDKNAFQELDHTALFQSCTKWRRTVNDPDRVLDYLDMAMNAAVSGRPGPVALMLPADLLNREYKGRDNRQASLGRFPLDRYSPARADIAKAAALLSTAKNPIVVAGGGVHISQASAAVSALQEKANLPVMTTLMGKGSVDERHPLSLGICGYAMGELAPGRHLRPVIESADVVLLIGTKTNQNGTDSWTHYPEDAKYIHIDVDGNEIGRNYEALRLVGDAKETVEALLKDLDGKRAANPDLEKKIHEARQQHKTDLHAAMAAKARPGLLRPERMMGDLQTVLTPDTIVTADASYSSLWVSCYLRAHMPGSRFLTPRGLAGLGWGLPLALGAKVARPDAPVFALVGDGGFGHSWSELEAAKRLGIKVVLIVLNNGILGYQKHAENVKFGEHSTACYFNPVDHAAVSRACGLSGLRVENQDEFLPALKEAMAADETCLIDVITDPAAYPPVTAFDQLNGNGL